MIEEYTVTIQIDREAMERVERVASATKTKRSVLLGILVSDGLDANAVSILLAGLDAPKVPRCGVDP